MIRSLRFTPFFRPYFILGVAALGANRRRFRVMNTALLTLYVPGFVLGIAWLAERYQFGIASVLAVLGALLVGNLVLRRASGD